MERTVGEVLPTVKANQEGIKQLLQQLATTRANKEKEAAEWKVGVCREVTTTPNKMNGRNQPWTLGSLGEHLAALRAMWCIASPARRKPET